MTNSLYTTLMECCIKGKTNKLKQLIESGVDPNSYSSNMIILASMNDHYDIVKLLVEDGRIDPSEMTNSALMYSIVHNQFNIFKLLIQDDRVLNVLSRREMFNAAIYHNNADVVNYFIRELKYIPNLSEIYNPLINALYFNTSKDVIPILLTMPNIISGLIHKGVTLQSLKNHMSKYLNMSDEEVELFIKIA